MQWLSIALKMFNVKLMIMGLLLIFIKMFCLLTSGWQEMLMICVK